MAYSYNYQKEDRYIDDSNQIIESNYHYYVKVIEANSGTPVSGARIYSDNMGDDRYTDRYGEAKWVEWENIPTLFNVNVSAPGYETVRVTKINGWLNTYPTTPIAEISLPKSNVSGYHYKIIVKDKSTNQAISGAQVRINKIDGTVYYDDIHNQTQSDGTFVFYSETESSLEFQVSKNGYREAFGTVTGSQEMNPPQTTILMQPVSAAHYYYVIFVKDTSGAPVSGAKFQLYKDLSYTNLYTQTELVTGANGRAVYDVGEMSFYPLDVYAKGTFLPPGYTWSDTSAKMVSSSLSANVPGCTITVQTYTSGSTYYYNFRVVNNVDASVVPDTKITYLNGSTVLATKTTDSKGEAFYSTNLQSVSVKITKAGYSTGYEQATLLTGSTISSSFRKILISPSNTIRVEFEDGTPAVGVKVYIFKYDQDHNIIYIKKGEPTHSGGYITPIDDVYYNNPPIYAKIPNYTQRVWTITKGSYVLQIPRASEEENPEESQEKHFNKLSISGIKKNIDAGHIDYNGGTDYSIRILDPDVITTMDIFTSIPIMMYNDKKNVIGSVDVGLKSDVNDLRLKMLNRYSGYYNPIFKDILFYNNLPKENGTELKYSNTSFQSDYKDNYGQFGIINNLWFHKVNDNKDVEILNTLTPYYPLTGQYALDCKDYNIFSSNWDMNYYTRQIDKDNSQLCQNIASMKNGLCMFGSKYLNVPNTIQIMGLTIGETDWEGEWNDDWITNPDGCPGEMMYKEVNNNSVDFYFFFTKRIIRFFKDKLKEEFERYISSTSSFGNEGLDDDIEEYVRKNVLKLYRLEKVIMFVRRTKKGQHNSRIENDYVSNIEFYNDEKTGEILPVTLEYYRKHGFVEVNTVTMTKMNRDDFDRKLVYNLRNGSQEEFGFGFILTKI